MPSYPYYPYFWAAYGITAVILAAYALSLFSRWSRTTQRRLHAEAVDQPDSQR